MRKHNVSTSTMHQRFRSLAPTSQATQKPPPDSTVETRLLAILLRTVPTSAREEHQSKEKEILEVFASLTVLESWHLHKRLSIAAADDALVVAFGRMIVERRNRLMAFLGDARRRAAIASAARAA